VGHPEQSLSDVRRARAVCAQYGRPDGVTFRFQVCTNSVEPSMFNRSRNLFAKDAERARLADEIEPNRPQVAIVRRSLPLAGGAEWLTGAGASPHGAFGGPSGNLQGEFPSENSAEPVASSESNNVSCFDFPDVSLIDFALWYQSVAQKFAEPCRRL